MWTRASVCVKGCASQSRGARFLQAVTRSHREITSGSQRRSRISNSPSTICNHEGYPGTVELAVTLCAAMHSYTDHRWASPLNQDTTMTSILSSLRAPCVRASLAKRRRGQTLARATMSGAPYWRAARPSVGEDIDMALHMSLSAIAYHGQTNHEHSAKDECLTQKH